MDRPVHVGTTFSAQRTFTAEDVRAFAQISGDYGRHHVEPDAGGRLMAHGLLVASLGTELGGRFNYLAREIVFEFLRPVFTGDTVSAELVITDVQEEESRLRISLRVVYKNQHGKVVIDAKSTGAVVLPPGV